MDLDTLYGRIIDEHLARGRSGKPVKIMTPDGERFGILSLNWDEETDEWVLCGEEADDGD
jgi:hypothetical protein